MAYYLLPGTSNPNFRLHVSENPEAVARRLQVAFESDATIDVLVDYSSSPDPMKVTLNPSMMPWWSVARIPDLDEL